MPTRERGQATPLMAVAMVMAAVVALALLHLGQEAVRSAEARTAADAAALAGAADGEEAARQLAAANGGALVSFEQIDDDVVVAVEREGHRVTARARASWPTGAGAAPSDTD